MSKTKKQSQIRFEIETDENHVPEKISWLATDGNSQELKECKSIIVSIWDHAEKETLRIDLWTKDMPVDEMQRHFQETLVTMAESFQKATGNPLVVKKMLDFCKNLAEETNKVAERTNANIN